MSEPHIEAAAGAARAPRASWARMLEHPAHRRCFTVLAALALMLLATALLGDASVGVVLIAVVAGAIGWTLIEYLLHRFAFHLPRTHPLSRLGARQHLDHHDVPSRHPISKPLGLTLPAIAIGVAALWLLGGAIGLAAGSGLVLGYLGYELLHVAAHVLGAAHPLPRVQRWHLEHHRDPRQRFGITSPLWDFVLGTALRSERRA